jgi:hypothetical protein
MDATQKFDLDYDYKALRLAFTAIRESIIKAATSNEASSK